MCFLFVGSLTLSNVGGCILQQCSARCGPQLSSITWELAWQAYSQAHSVLLHQKRSRGPSSVYSNKFTRALWCASGVRTTVLEITQSSLLNPHMRDWGFPREEVTYTESHVRSVADRGLEPRPYTWQRLTSCLEYRKYSRNYFWFFASAPLWGQQGIITWKHTAVPQCFFLSLRFRETPRKLRGTCC